MWLADESRWPALALKLAAAGEFGIDTETYGQPDRTSPQFRTRVHCWSVAWLTGVVSPRGHRRAAGVVLPREALDSPELRAVLASPAIRKWAHNAPHDHHSLVNEGVVIEALDDTLQWARVAVPGMSDYGLKDMERWALGKPPRPDFLHVVSYPKKVQRSTFKTVRACVCGARPCRARASSEWWDAERGWFRPHERVEERVETVHEREVCERYEVTDFVPGAQLDPRMWLGDLPPRGRGVTPEDRFDVVADRLAVWTAYSLADAVSGIEIVDWLRNRKQMVTRYPWQPYSLPS